MSFEPVDLILVAHDAFRRDLADIDAAALSAARDGRDVSGTIKRIDFFTEMLFWHAQGEDSAIFPAMEKVAPDVAAPYEIDHQGLDLAADGLTAAIEAEEPVLVARATAAFKFHLDMHLYKEEVHLYRLFTDRLRESEQADAVGLFTDALAERPLCRLRRLVVPPGRAGWAGSGSPSVAGGHAPTSLRRLNEPGGAGGRPRLR